MCRITCPTPQPKISFQLLLAILADLNYKRGKMKLFIGSLPYDISEAELTQMFSHYGEVIKINLVLDQFSGQSKGFAFVEMATRSGGQQAMEGLNNSRYRSKTLVCNEAIPKKKGKRRR